MDQSLQYVKTQLSQGKTRDQIKMSLLGGGWQNAQVEALFKRLDGPVAVPVSASTAAPIVSTVQPVPQTSPVIKPSSKPVDLTAPVKDAAVAPPAAAAKPIQPAANSSATVPKKGSIGKMILWTLIVIVVAVAALIGGAVYISKRNTNNTNTTSSTPAPTSTLYSSNGITFSYPVAWKKTSVDTLLNTVSTSAGLQDLFFTPDSYTTIQNAAGQVNTGDATTAASNLAAFNQQISNLAALTVSYTTNISACPVVESGTAGVTVPSPTCTPPTSDVTAKTQATNALKTSYAADGKPTFNGDTAVDQSKIKTVTVDSKTSYWITNGPTTKPYVVLFVPVAGGAIAIDFPSATSIETLTADQLALYASIKLQ